MAFTKFLKIKMLEQELNTEGLALLMNKSSMTITSWRAGKTIPKTRQLMDLAGHLGCSVEELLESFIK